MNLENRISHALLFLGKEGSGALSLARAFAQFIVCEKVNGKASSKVPDMLDLFGNPATETPVTEEVKKELHDSCGECPACLKSMQLIHPDIHFSFPVISKKSDDHPKSSDFINEWREFITEQPYANNYDWLQFIGAENKQGNITVYECMDIIRKINLKSFESEYKILIMWMPEFLGNVGNKLLKLLEEPPPDTLFILVAENESLILPTILSRTQLVKIPALQNLEVEAALELRNGIPLQKAEQIAAITEGNFHEALQMLEHAEDDWEVMARDWLNTILKTGPAAQIKWIEVTSKMGREKQKQFLRFFNHSLQHAIRLRVMGECAARKKNQDETGDDDFAIRLNKLCDVSQQYAIVQELDKAAYYIERNANAKILFHALTIKLYHIISNKSVILMS